MGIDRNQNGSFGSSVAAFTNLGAALSIVGPMTRIYAKVGE